MAVNTDTAPLPPRPQWLDGEPEIRALLGELLDKLDKKPASERVHLPSIQLSKNVVPGLYHHNELSDRTWTLLCELKDRILEIKLDRRRNPYDAAYVGARLRLLPGGEAICRAWLGRPAQQRYKDQWSAAVDVFAAAFADQGQALKAQPIEWAEYSADDIVAGFARVAAYSRNGLTLRQLSARCFWGHSKLLDTREDLLRQLYPGLQITTRPLLVHVHLPESYQGVLFIENQDTYAQALVRQWSIVNNLALVFSAGFRGSADRIRTADGVSLHYHRDSNNTMRPAFEAWWFDNRPSTLPAWFWGDLDYSGMAILKALRQRFDSIRAWPPGYEPLRAMLTAGGGHPPQSTGKQEQRDPQYTGCPYADEALLPAIRERKRFVDQESV